MFEGNLKKSGLALLVFIVLISFQAQSQEVPIYSQFFLNPYIINPAYAGYENQAAVYASHRQQWVGIEDAPVTSFLSFNMPLKNRLSIGANITNDQRGLINTSSADFTLAYTLPTVEGHYFRFGLSAGFGMNSLDLDEVDNLSDPALANLSENNFYTTAQFGLNYHLKGFNIGMAFPGLLDNDMFSKQDFNNPQINPLEKYIIMANYKIHLPNGILALEPHLLYRQFGHSFDQLEALGILHIHDKVWLGGSYKTDYGFTALAGLNLKDKFTFGYAYEIASSQVNGFTDGTHEFLFGIKIGKKKKPVQKQKKVKKLKNQEIEGIGQNEEEIIEVEPDIKEEGPEKKTQHELAGDPGTSATKEPVEPSKVERYETVSRGNHFLELNVGHYVIVGVFSKPANAGKHIDQLAERGFDARFGYNSEKGLYYVYLNKSSDIGSARSERNKIRKISIYQFEDAWILSVK